jgi:peptidoglycan/LPS O-acetylase OafA/YrhL
VFLHVWIAFLGVIEWMGWEAALPRNSPTSDTLNWANYAAHIAFLQGLIPKWMHTLVDGSWFIVVQIYFFLCYALFGGRLCRDLAGSLRAYAASIVLSILFVVIERGRTDGFSYYGFPVHFSSMILGVVLYRTKSAMPSACLPEPVQRALLLCSLVVMAGLVSGQASPLGLAAIYALCFSPFVLFGSTFAGALPQLVVRVFSRLGRQSYSLFFVHLFLLKCWSVVESIYSVDFPFLTAFGINLLLAGPLSWLVSEALVHPLDRWLTLGFKRKVARSIGQSKG